MPYHAAVGTGLSNTRLAHVCCGNSVLGGEVGRRDREQPRRGEQARARNIPRAGVKGRSEGAERKAEAPAQHSARAERNKRLLLTPDISDRRWNLVLSGPVCPSRSSPPPLFFPEAASSPPPRLPAPCFLPSSLLAVNLAYLLITLYLNYLYDIY